MQHPKVNVLLPGRQVIKPYTNEEILPRAVAAVTAEFSPDGLMLAVGCGTGEIVLYSFVAQAPVTKYKPMNTGKVIAVKWVQDCIYALCDSNMFFRWNYYENCLVEPPKLFDFKASSLDIHPADTSQVLVAGKIDVVIYNIATGESLSLKQSETATEWFGCYLSDGNIVVLSTSENVFYLLSGNGTMLLSANMSADFQSPAKLLRYNGANMFLTNSRDRTLRVFELRREPLEFRLVKEISDYIERKRWSACAFFKVPNLDTHFVLACLQETGCHNLKLYDTVEVDARVSLAKHMQSPLGAATWLCSSVVTHTHPVICVVTQPGSVILWCSLTFVKNKKWSTSLGIPNFIQLEDGNVEYEEAEDEFDEGESSIQPLDLTCTHQPRPFRIVF